MEKRKPITNPNVLEIENYLYKNIRNRLIDLGFQISQWEIDLTKLEPEGH